MSNNTLTALEGVKVGHSTHLDELTGCTVVLFDDAFQVAYAAGGGAVGAFNTEALHSDKTNYGQRGIFVSGGSDTGLMSGGEIVKYLREHGQGSETTGRSGPIYNPGVTGAIVFDMGMRIAQFDPAFAREACENASKEPVQNGNVGAGTGTAVGKFRWLEAGTKSGAMKAGVGSARINAGNGIRVCALSVVNALGNIVLPNGDVLAGNREEGGGIKPYDDLINFVSEPMPEKSNTTISIVGINVAMGSKLHLEKVAQMASHGQVRAINPVNTSGDGDTVFVFSTGELNNPFNERLEHFQETDESLYSQADFVGYLAAKAVQESIYDACHKAESIQLDSAYKGIVPSAKDFRA